MEVLYIIPDPQVNNAPASIWPYTFDKLSIMAGICSLFQLFPEIMHAPEVVIQLQNDQGRYLARTT